MKKGGEDAFGRLLYTEGLELAMGRRTGANF
jgi:hypothetical protein